MSILRSSDATLLANRITIVNVILPVLCAIVILLIALFHLLTAVSRNILDPIQGSFVFYCIASSLFLISFSELPREYFSMAFAGYLHFSLRTLFDFSLFLLVWRYFGFSSRWARLLGGTYILIWASFWIEYAVELISGSEWKTMAGFDLAYFTMRVAVPSVLFPPFIGLLGIIRRREDEHRTILLVLFALLVPMQVWDVLIFHGVIKGTYLVKFYPIMVGVVFGWVLMERYHSGIRKLYLADQRAMQAAQVAHDIKSPLTALSFALGSVDKLPEQHRVLIRAAVGRIQDIANQLLLQSDPQRGAKKQGAPTERPHLVASLIQTIVSEKRAQYQRRSGLTLLFRGEPSNYHVFANVDHIEFGRMISNLISNSVEAIAEKGDVTLSLETTADTVRIRIEDKGCGIQSHQLEQLRLTGGTFNKVGGTGLGLAHARTWITKWNGKLEIHSVWGSGTRVEVVIPRAKPPSWHVPAIVIKPGQAVVVVDDDESIHQFWNARLAPLMESGKIELRGYRSPDDLKRDVEFLAKQQHSALFLVDYEYGGLAFSGLDLIEQLKIQANSILVTSRNEDVDVIRRCEMQKVSLLPKNVAEWLDVRWN